MIDVKAGEPEMEKVKCTRCGSIGYTASPESVKCQKCGGDHKTIKIDKHNYKAKSENFYYHIESLNERGE